MSSHANALESPDRRALPWVSAATPMSEPGTGLRCVDEHAAAFTDRMAGRLRPISLEQLNASSSMLIRRDNKYVIPEDQLLPAWDELARRFDILEIDGRRDFTYDTCYFDDPARTCYFDHHRMRRRRCKIRMRKYVDAQLCFAEIKLKGKQGLTFKERVACPLDQYGALDDNALAHIRAAYRDQYERELEQALEPVMWMRYRRMTLVAKDGGERMTIDRGLVFSDSSGSHHIDDNLVIVETKSGNANGIADKILRSLHHHPTNGASKYCVSLAALRQVSKYNNWRRALRKLNCLPTPVQHETAGTTRVRRPVNLVGVREAATGGGPAKGYA